MREKVVARVSRWRVKPRCANDYATHLPPLIALSRLLRIETVLELGAGRFSTVSFLDRSLFPHVSRVESLENDRAWKSLVLHLAREDPRLEIRLVSGEMARAVESLALRDYDLILVDDSTLPEERASTIRAVLSRREGDSVVAIHDFEVPAYRAAVKSGTPSGGTETFSFRSLTPQTGVVFRPGQLPAAELRRLDRVIGRQGTSLDPADVLTWRETLGALDRRGPDRPKGAR